MSEENQLEVGDEAPKLIERWAYGFGWPTQCGQINFVNKLVGGAKAIVHDQPGVTRDWQEADARLVRTTTWLHTRAWKMPLMTRWRPGCARKLRWRSAVLIW